MMDVNQVYYLPSGRIFVMNAESGYPIEATEMRDVQVHGKSNFDVRTTMDPKIIWKHLVDFEDKWLMTVSTQKGCVHKCKFCDVAPLPFEGNLTVSEILGQVGTILDATPYVKKSNKVKLGFARMGEPAHNLDNVLTAMQMLPAMGALGNRDLTWLPCFNSILPEKTMQGHSGLHVIDSVIKTKEESFDGMLHFQISVNSTDESVRKDLFGGADVMRLVDIIDYVNHKKITQRTVTLNFIVMKDVPIDVQYLKAMGLNGDKFAVKLIPLNETTNANDHNLETLANYNNYDDLLILKSQFEDMGVPVVADAIAKCEEAGLCCGQIAHIHI